MSQTKTNRRDFLSKLIRYSSVAMGGSLVVATSSCDNVYNRGTYSVDSSKCDACGDCLSSCGHGAITISSTTASISSSNCVGCGKCVGRCDKEAISKD